MAVEKKNIFLNNTNSTFDYTSPKRMGGLSIPQRPSSKSHGEIIQQKLKTAYERSTVQKQTAAIKYKSGTYLEFTGSSGYDLALQKLENRAKGIRLLNVKEQHIIEENEEKKIVKATVYVPEGQEFFLLIDLILILTKLQKQENQKIMT